MARESYKAKYDQALEKIKALGAALQDKESRFSRLKQEMDAETEDFNRGYDLAEKEEEPSETASDAEWNGYYAGSFPILEKKLDSLSKAFPKALLTEEERRVLEDARKQLTGELQNSEAERDALKEIIRAKNQELRELQASADELLQNVIRLTRQLGEVSESEALLQAQVSSYQETAERRRLMHEGFRHAHHLRSLIRFLRQSKGDPSDLAKLIGESRVVSDILWTEFGGDQ